MFFSDLLINQMPNMVSASGTRLKSNQIRTISLLGVTIDQNTIGLEVQDHFTIVALRVVVESRQR